MNPSMYGSFGSVPMGGYVPFNPPAPDMSNATNMQQQFQMWLQQKVSMGQVAPQHLAAFSSAPLLWDPFQFHLLPMATEPRFAESIPNPIAPTPITFPSSSSSSFSNAAAMPMYDSRGNFPRAPSPTGNDDDEEDGDDILHNYVPSSQKKKFSTSVPSNNDVPANVSSQVCRFPRRSNETDLHSRSQTPLLSFSSTEHHQRGLDHEAPRLREDETEILDPQIRITPRPQEKANECRSSLNITLIDD